MKHDYLWAKTILSIYRYLERIAGAIDKIIFQRGIGSANICDQNYYYNNILSVSQKIIDLSERKVTLINLKLIVEDTLKVINQEDAEILIEKFLDGLKMKDIEERHNFSPRTAFRKVDGAVRSFASGLSVKGYNDSKLEEMLKKETWVFRVYEQLSAKSDDNLSLSKVFLAKAVSM